MIVPVPIPNTTFSRFELANRPVIVDQHGYVNGTKLTATIGRRFVDWTRLRRTQTFKQAVLQQLLDQGTPILGCEDHAPTVDDLCYLVTGGQNRETWGTYLHPLLVTNLACWISPSFGASVAQWVEEWRADNQERYLQALDEMTVYEDQQPEDVVQEKLTRLLGCRREVSCVYGRIDLLTHHLLIEVKSREDWMKGLGQLLSYGVDYPDRRKVLYIYDGGLPDTHVAVCRSHKIRVVTDPDRLMRLEARYRC